MALPELVHQIGGPVPNTEVSEEILNYYRPLNQEAGGQIRMEEKEEVGAS